MTVLLQDLRYAFRTLRKSLLFAIVAVVSLALGIGANTAIFSLVNQLMLELLPVKHPEQLVLLRGEGDHYGSNTGPNAISYPMYQDFRDKNSVFQGMFCKYGTRLSLATEGRTELVSAELVSGNYFPVLGVRAALGRVFTASDDLIQGGDPLVVLSYAYWTSRFAADPGVIGRKVIVAGYPLTIVGVSQAGFDGVEKGYSPQIRIPMMMKHQVASDKWYTLNDRRGRFVRLSDVSSRASRSNRPKPACNRCSTRFSTWKCGRRSSPKQPITRASSFSACGCTCCPVPRATRVCANGSPNRCWR